MARLDSLFHEMQDRGASDLHIVVGRPPMLRTRGDLVETEHERLTASKAEELIVEILTPAQKEQVERHLDLDFAYELPGLARFRANVMHQHRGLGAVFRIIPTDIMTLEELGMPPSVRKLAEMPAGLILVTGPTGSGKSTTLATMVDFINRNRTDHIITIEDPVEFVHENKKCLVNQREVGTHTEGFKRALRAALREDPDIVLVGEMRDLETIAIAIETAETGHLVFGTLHTTTAPSTVDRIIDQFPADRQSQIRVMLSESLRGVVAQMLCKKIGGGRVACYEILITNPAVSNLIREGKTYQLVSVMQTGKAQGMQTLNDHLVKLVKEKVVEAKEAFLKSTDKKGLKEMYIQNNIPIEGLPGA